MLPDFKYMGTRQTSFWGFFGGPNFYPYVCIILVVYSPLCTWYFAEAGQTKVLFVKNLSFDTEKDTLLEAFEGATDARIATDADTGRSRG